MDIKNKRRDSSSGLTVEGDYPIGKKGHGNAASDNNVGWDIRASSWQMGANTDMDAIEAEKREQDIRFGTPHEDNLPNPASQSNDVDAALPNPHNFSSNPGFMSSTTMATTGGPANGGTARIATPGSGRSLRGRSSGGPVIGRTATSSKGNVSTPAPGDIDPGQEGGPQVVSSGYNG